jgi:phosphonate transport system substrate-binding protein
MVQAPVSDKKIYRFGIHPLHNPQRMLTVFGPVFDILNAKNPNVVFQLESSRDYNEFNEKLYSRKLDFALPNPYQTIMAIEKGYRVFAKMGDDQNFKGIILVRKDSPFKTLKDLKGKKISYPAKTALAACLMPQYHLHTNGLDVNKDLTHLFVGSQESSILSVFNKQSDAAATWPPPWNALIKERPEIEKEVRILAETPHLINNSLMARDDIDSPTIATVAQAFLSLQDSEPGRLILQKMELSKYESAQNKDYEKVKVFLEKYKKTIGPIE